MANEKQQPWGLSIDNFTGYAPAYYESTYPSFGNKGQASAMRNINTIDPSFLVQGPGVANLTAGTEAGVVDTLITAICRTAITTNVSYAIGQNKIYKMSATAVTDDVNYPMTIDKAVVTDEVATDLIYYKSNLYVFYNHSGGAGDIAKVDVVANTIDPDWGSTTPTGAETLHDNAHYAVMGGDDVVYFTNGKFIGKIEDTTLDAEALDIWDDAVTTAITWNNNRVKFGYIRPDVTGSNFSKSAIYTWDGVSASWEGDPIEISGEIGALYTKNGIDYIWWKDSATTGSCCFGYLNGLRVTLLNRYDGTLPNQAQVGEHEGHIAWVSSNRVMLWGAKDESSPVKLMQYISGSLETMGTFGTPFGDIMVSSYKDNGALTDNYSLAQRSGYSINSFWTTLAYDVSMPGHKSQIDTIQVKTQQLATGAKVDFTLYYNNAKSNTELTQIAYSTANHTLHKILSKGVHVEDFQLKINFANGSVTNPVKINKIMIRGHYIKES